MADYESEYLKELRDVLSDLRLPELRDRSAGEPRKAKYKVAKSQVTVALLSRAPARIAAAIEGGRQHRESVFLVLHHSWLERRGEKLYLKKGVWFQADTMQATLDVYEGRQVTYFANFFTPIASFGERTEGVELEKGLECPRSLGHELEEVMNDKLFSRVVLSSKLVTVPRTLAFCFKPKHAYSAAENSKMVRVVVVKSKTGDTVQGRILKQLAAFFTNPTAKVVVRHGGPTRQRESHVTYLTAGTAFARTVELLANVNEGDSVLVEEYQETMPSQKVESERMLPLVQSAGDGRMSGSLRNAAGRMLKLQEYAAEEEEQTSETAGEDEPLAAPASGSRPRSMAFVVRVVTTLGLTSKPETTATVCMTGPAHSPLLDETALPHSLYATLRAWGVRRSEREHLEELLHSEAERVHMLLLEAERSAREDLLADSEAGSDIVSTDFVLALRGSSIIPTVLRVHDHDSLELVTRFEEAHDSSGKCLRLWVERMLARSQDYVLRGRTVLIIGASGYGKMPTWDMLLSWGLKLVVVDNIPDHMCKKRVYKYIQYEKLVEHDKDEANAKRIVELLKENGIADPATEIDGVTTIYDPCVVVCAHVARLLGKPGNDPQAHEIAKDKFLMADALSKAKHRTAILPPPKLYTGLSIKVESEDDVRKALEGESAPMTLPCVLKHSFGMCGIGAKLVFTPDEAVHEFKTMDANLAAEIGGDSSGLSFGHDMFLMEFLDGSEHDIDVVMFEGDLVCAVVSDNGPTRLPYFTETTAAMPSILPKEEVEALIAGSETLARAVGLNHGVFDCEFKYTTNGGPKLIEINARLGGHGLLSIAEAVHNINLLKFVVMTACGIRPIVRKKIPKANGTLVSTQLYASQHGKTLYHKIFPKGEDGKPIDERKLSPEDREKKHVFRKLHAQGVLHYNPYVSYLDSDTGPEWAEAVGNIGCQGSSHEEAAKKLVQVVNALGLDDDAAVKADFFLAGMGVLNPSDVL